MLFVDFSSCPGLRYCRAILRNNNLEVHHFPLFILENICMCVCVCVDSYLTALITTHPFVKILCVNTALLNSSDFHSLIQKTTFSNFGIMHAFLRYMGTVCIS